MLVKEIFKVLVPEVQKSARFDSDERRYRTREGSPAQLLVNLKRYSAMAEGWILDSGIARPSR